MGRTGKPLIYLNEDEVLEINRRVIAESGGFYSAENDNLANPGSLRYILEAVQGSFFGVDRLPTVFHKAAAYAWEIIIAHTFNDGNKRTGMFVSRSFLWLNGYTLTWDKDDVVSMALSLAKREVTPDQFAQWITDRASPRFEI